MPLPAWKVWGFDLSELKFSSFGHKALFDPRYHLRKTRIIIYQCAMLVCLAAECTATYSLDKYEDLQTHIETTFPGSHLYQNDIIDVQIVTIVFNVLVACIFGAEFFFLAQYPAHTYPKWYRRSMEGAAIFICLGLTAAALSSTIIVARNSAVLGHVSQSVYDAALAEYFRPPIKYSKWAVNIAFVVLIWIGLCFVIASTFLMFKAAAWDEIHGAGPMEIGSDEKLVEAGQSQKVHRSPSMSQRRSTDERGIGSNSLGNTAPVKV
ncbi:hypothetical protein BCR35DRAFT_4922 [Leucosporidium creatinivorum]|uniref:Uncharacterized protein n=1 Tax=Leucosporidium creatinivorum TaxID=106004 RepID=A0A1Y2G6F0_9BASI|nr:hypothetical protein BCR35DRAFT_4922 [Leucosporidium creatinivorum]